jgi:uncharacterized membrane protein YkvA (DUF1232 family)
VAPNNAGNDLFAEDSKGSAEGKAMPLKLELDLSDDDLDYFRKVMDVTWQRNSKREESELVECARRLLEESKKTSAPAYVRMRLEDLGMLISMLEDQEWPLEEQDRRRIRAAISYFADPSDMIADKIPGLGFLDDALMAELVIRDVKHELDGYREFCKYREEQEMLRGKDAHLGREDWVGEKHRQMWFRIHRRQQEHRDHGSTAGPTDPILSYKY